MSEQSILEKRIELLERKLVLLLEIKGSPSHQPIRPYPVTYNIKSANMKDANGKELFYVDMK
jgi:hypothetical protein